MEDHEKVPLTENEVNSLLEKDPQFRREVLQAISDQKGCVSLVVGILGKTQVGKSSFIKRVMEERSTKKVQIGIGSGEDSTTTDVVQYTFHFEEGTTKLVMYDTPGLLDSTKRSDNDILSCVKTTVANQKTEIEALIYVSKFTEITPDQSEQNLVDTYASFVLKHYPKATRVLCVCSFASRSIECLPGAAKYSKKERKSKKKDIWKEHWEKKKKSLKTLFSKYNTLELEYIAIDNLPLCDPEDIEEARTLLDGTVWFEELMKKFHWLFGLRVAALYVDLKKAKEKAIETEKDELKKMELMNDNVGIEKAEDSLIKSIAGIVGAGAITGTAVGLTGVTTTTVVAGGTIVSTGGTAFLASSLPGLLCIGPVGWGIIAGAGVVGVGILGYGLFKYVKKKI